jgi:acyl carrier protein
MIFSKQDIFSRVQSVIREAHNVPTDSINLESNLKEDFKMDSLDKVELAMDIEAEFSLFIPDGVEDNFKTVQDIVDYVTDELVKQGAVKV